MTTRARRTRIDSVQGAIDIARSQQQLRPTWPELVKPAADDELRTNELALFEQLISARALVDWAPHEIVTLGRIASAQAFVMREQHIAQQEGAVVLGGRRGDAPVANPRLAAIAIANGGLVQMLRSVGLHAPAASREVLNRSGAAARAADKVLKRAKGSAEDDLLGLLA